MSNGKMHADEVDIDASLVRRLLAAQFPQWAALPIAPVPSAGTDNAIYRLGDDLAVRLPRIGWASEQADFEREWLPRLAPHLPLAISVPLAIGEPGEGYPWRWAIYRWLPGEAATIERLADPDQTARDLARFIIALRQIDITGGPRPEPGQRGAPLATRDAETRAAIDSLRGILDADDLRDVTAAWDEALQAPIWDGPPMWLHGDLQAGNLLIVEGRLSAVIDWGALGVGDPACDHQIAWNFFSAGPRGAFRAALQDDDAAWARGRGWALSVALIALPYYLHTSPPIAERSRYTIAEVLADYRR
jgi:aminoglycoside phosphotransferase (APT) family kinase protein